MSGPWERYKKTEQAEQPPQSTTQVPEGPWNRYVATGVQEESDPTIPTKTESAIRGAVQGATFGFADEIQGGALGAIEAFKSGGALSFKEAYEQQRDQARERYKLAQQENPMSYLGGQVVGGIGGSALTPGAGMLGLGAKAANMIGGVGKTANIARGIVGAGIAGAGSGALSAAGESEAKDVKGIASDAAGGAAAGGAFGGAFGGAGKLLPGVRGSVSNDFFAKRVLPIFNSPEASKTAEKYLKSPEARNEIVKLATRDTVVALKDEVRDAVARDVKNFKKSANKIGQALLMKAEPQMEEKFAEMYSVFNKYGKAIEKLDPQTTPNLQRTMLEVQDVLAGNAQKAARELGEEVAEGAPYAQRMRDIRSIIRGSMYKNGNPNEGLKDAVSRTEAEYLMKLESKTDELFKSVKGAKIADELYSKAANYTAMAEKDLFKKAASGGKEISNAAVESFVLGKGAPGKSEDMDRIFEARKLFVDAMAKATKKTPPGLPEGALKTAREIMDFNRLGTGESTGRSLAPLLTVLKNPQLAPFVLASYNPRAYLTALAQADNLTSEDRKVMKALINAVGRQKDIAATKIFTNKDGEE